MSRVGACGACLLAVALGCAAAIASAQEAVPGGLVDFELEETSGATRTLRAVRGRVVILFYEDREHTDLNRDFKHLLHRFILDNRLQDQTTTYAIANVRGVDGVMRDLARGVVRAVASRYGIRILLDWDGVLQRAPFSLRDGDANVALVDRTGRLRWRHTGVIGERERQSFFRMLRTLLREPAPAPPP